MFPNSPVRTVAASRLRSLAERLAPSIPPLPAGTRAPLVRLSGRWWYRGELIAERAAEQPGQGVHVRP